MMASTKVLKILEMVILTGSLSVLLTTAGLYLSSVSFDRGFIAGEAWTLMLKNIPRSEASYKVNEHFSGSGESTYEYLGRKYSYATGYILCFLVAWILTACHRKYVKTSGTSSFTFQLAFSIFLFLAIYQYGSIVAEKRLWSMDAFWNIPLQELARFAYPIDWICLLLLIVILITVILLHVLRIWDHRIRKHDLHG
ncbi:MAG: hypothetical protein KF881_04230 [Acidobacteria bacterium]|nr:hypothetical protein [Acidobacteriota bacterium]